MTLEKNLFKHLMLVASGTGSAQIINFISTLILSRLYVPTNFGIFMFYFSFVAISSAIVNGRYHLAIPFEKKETNIKYLFLMSSVIAVVLSAVIAFGIYFLKKIYSIRVLPDDLAGKEGLIFFGIFIGSLNLTYRSFLNRYKKFKILSAHQILIAITILVCSTSFYFFEFYFTVV